MSEIYKDLDKLYEKIEKIECQNKRLHFIIKEVREYIPILRRCTSYEKDEKLDDLLEILDKENK